MNVMVCVPLCFCLFDCVCLSVRFQSLVWDVCVRVSVCVYNGLWLFVLACACLRLFVFCAWLLVLVCVCFANCLCLFWAC